MDVIEQVIPIVELVIYLNMSMEFLLYILHVFYYQLEEEVGRLNVQKVSRMKELVFKKQNELEDIYRGVHMDVDSETARQILISIMDSGTI